MKQIFILILFTLTIGCMDSVFAQFPGQTDKKDADKKETDKKTNDTKVTEKKDQSTVGNNTKTDTKDSKVESFPRITKNDEELKKLVSKEDSCLKGDCDEGIGLFVYKDGDRYDGKWESGLSHGKGVYIYRNGDKYTGDWDTGYMHGYGIMVYGDGSPDDVGYWFEDGYVGTTEQEFQDAATAPEETQEVRVALVIGNASYGQGGELKNPVNDAEAIAKTLEEVGFEVIKKTNVGLKDMRKAFDEFTAKLEDADVAVLYYAGHGVQVGGQNFIIPVDAELKSIEDVEYGAMPVNYAVAKMEKFRDNVNIIILDACRNNPFGNVSTSSSGGGGGGQTRGFAVVPASSGSLIAFATSEGTTAADGDGKNGVYTEELMKQLTKAQRIEDVFIETRNAVEARTKGQQVPQEWSKLKGKFYFVKE